MATNDFVQHNPTEANQQPTATFAGDSLTTGGIGVDDIMPSDWMNARWYQDSTVCAALMQMMANKGFNVSVADLGVLTGVLSNILTNQDVKPNLTMVGFSPTPTFDASATNGFRFTLAANVTSSTLINAGFGRILTFALQNPSNFTFVWPSNVLYGQPVVSGGPVNLVIQQFIMLEDGNAYPLETMLSVLAGILATPATQTNVTGARSFGVAYNNPSASKTMTVSITFSVPSHTGSSLTATVNGSTYGQQSNLNAGSTSISACLTFVVPGGGNYVVNYDVPVSASQWIETV